jgi:adenosylmethionine---8-amino-7-oxononanoate aminotransferase
MSEAAHNATSPGWQQTGYRHIWMPYCQMQTAPLPVPVVATEDVYLVLADGRRVIDGLASWWTACHGYNHPHIAAAIERQLHTMPHVMFGGINHEPALTLATRLAKLLPGDLNRVFFCDSGSVAVEVAMKMAVQYWRNQGSSAVASGKVAKGQREPATLPLCHSATAPLTTRNKFVTFKHAYHGDTTGAMSLCDPVGGMHAHFKGFLLKQYPQPIPLTAGDARTFDEFVRTHLGELAGVFIEPLVQGAGGMKFHPPESLRIIRDTCDRHRLLLICDELATGFGRTGSMFAVEQADVVPDIICLGKALTGGTIGMAATVATDRVFERFLFDDPDCALMHGPTYMANPLACAAANASLDLFETEPRLQQAAAIEARLREAFAPARRFPGVVDVRVKGAVGVIQVANLHHLDRLRQRFLDAGVFVRPFGDMIYITPPLTITPGQLTTLCEAVVQVTDEWSRW